MSEILIHIEGKQISCSKGVSIIQAMWDAGISHVKNTGCMEGVCGSCRVLVRYYLSQQIVTELACRVTVKHLMQVSFIEATHSVKHLFNINDIRNSDDLNKTFSNVFPEAPQCRRCGGCDIACPKDIKVEYSVELAIAGEFEKVSDLFAECVLCDFCEDVCPEDIAPNHIGMFSRQVHSLTLSRPLNLVHCLQSKRV